MGLFRFRSIKDTRAKTTDAKPLNMPVKNAYEVLVADIFYGREKFVSTSSLLTRDWKIWTPMLKDYDDESKKVHEPVIYGFGGKEVFDSVERKVARKVQHEERRVVNSKEGS